MSTTPDITIIGGGIMGLLTARECRLAGASVTVIDKHQLGQESSWAGGGILLPIYPWRQHQAITQLVVQSLKLYPALIDAIHNTTSQIDPEFIRSGLLICKNPDYADAIAWCAKNSISFNNPSKALCDGLNSEFNNPLWLPKIRQVRNPRLLKAVQEDLKCQGVHFITQSELLNLHIQQQRVESITTSTGHYPVAQVILTTGAWTGQLWQQFFPTTEIAPTKIQPIKGQMLLFDAKPDTLTTMVLDDAHYLIPRLDGKILAGSTVEQSGFNKTTDLETKTKLTDFARRLIPALNDFPVIAHWAGLRPGTEQGIPYIAQHPTLKNLSINAGHFRNGLTMAPASAQLLVDLLLKRTPKIAPEPYQFNSLH
ncbi:MULTISPECIES: glycine oxidase ThiO [Methylobacter]